MFGCQGQGMSPIYGPQAPIGQHCLRADYDLFKWCALDLFKSRNTNPIFLKYEKMIFNVYCKTPYFPLF